MGPTVMVLIFVTALSLWGFLKFTPYTDNPRAIKMFNILIVGTCAFFGLLWYLEAWVWLGELVRRDYLPLLGIGGALALCIVLLGVFFLVRLWIFRGQGNRPGRW